MRAALSAATTTLDELALNNLGNIRTLPNATTFRWYIASIDLASFLSTKVDRNEQLACLYFQYREADVFLARYHGGLDWKEKFAVEDHLRTDEGRSSDALSGEWHVLDLDGECFLQQNYRIGPADIGVLILAQELLNRVQGEESMHSTYILTDAEGRILASENTQRFCVGDRMENAAPFDAAYDGSMLFTQEIPDCGLRLSCVVPSGQIYAGFGKMPYLLLGIGFAVVLAVAVLMRYLQKIVVTPVRELSQAAQEIERGNIEYRIPTTKGYAREFSDLIEMFNNMTQEIKDLKIRNYEEALERTHAEIKYLQLQLHPHFYLNAITTISSLSMRGENAQIQRFIDALSTYLRYLFTDNQNSATIESEIRHAEDYIRLQQISHADNIFYYISVDPKAAGIPMQKLLVQTFVENIFKHAFDGETSISIFIRASMVRRDGETFARVTVEDTGCGFPPAFLEKMASQDGVENVGIANVCRTMQFTYGRPNLIHLENNEQGGARVVIDIPVPNAAPANLEKSDGKKAEQKEE